MMLRLFLCISLASISLLSSGCADLLLASHRDDEFLDQYRYVLGEHYLTVDGVRLCYQECGEGEAVIILPGLATSIDFWQLSIPALARTHHVLAIDLPGFGNSDKPDVGYDLPWIVDRILSFMDAKGVTRASLIGGSVGGQLALMLAIRCPDRVDKLVLMGSSGAWPEPSLITVGALYAFWNDAVVTDHIRRNWPDIWHKMFLHQTPVAQRLFRYQMALRANRDRYWAEGRASSRTLKSIFFHSCLKDLAKVAQPTLLVWGEQDHIHLLSEARALREGIPHSRLVIVPDAGHEVMIDQPIEFNRLVQAFLAHGLDAVGDRNTRNREHS